MMFRRFLLQSTAWRCFSVAAPRVIYARPGARLMQLMDLGAGDYPGVPN